MESLKFYEVKPLSWKILYRSDNPDDKSTKALQDKIKKFIADRSMDKLTLSYDIYTMDKNFVVIHGMKTLESAKGIASILKEFKDYKVPNEAIVISNENYKIVQMKKNLEEYLTTPPSEPLPPKPYTPKAKPQANNKHEDRPIPRREERPEDKAPDEKQKEMENQLPPGMPPTPGGSTRSKGQEPGKEKK